MSEKDRLGTADSFLDAIVAGLDSPALPSVRTRVCIMCVDHCLPSCMIVSDLANSVGRHPVEAYCDDRVPGWVDAGCEVILVSHRGDCPQIIEAYDSLRARGCRITCVTAGGELLSRCMADGAGTVTVPEGMCDWDADGYVLGAVCAMLSGSGVLDADETVRSAVLSLRSGASSEGHVPEDIARSLKGRTFAVYSTSDVRACARSWADSMSSHLGVPTFCSELPEFDHNELVGWSDPNVHSPGISMIVLRSGPGDGIVATIVRCMLEVLSENGREVTVVDLGAGSTVERNLRGIVVGREVSRIMGAGS